MRQNFHLGFDYYPEHWPDSMWADDLTLMRDAGATCVRIAEFAWSRMEPEEGRYEFTWLDRFFDLADRHDMGIILGTPTAAPPPWAWQTYPEIVMVDHSGMVAPTTGRRYNCPTSQTYLELCDKIVEQMARRYGTHRQLIGWQTDNEVSGQVCLCNACQRACLSWLRAKCGTVQRLNAALGLVFWAHEATDWEEVILPRRGLDKAHPSIRLEVHRFFSEQWTNFLGRQVAIITQHSPKRWTTHNLPGVGIAADLWEMAKAHDFLALDTYPKAMIDPPTRVAMLNDVVRSTQDRPHWVMEIQSGGACTKFYKAPRPRPGQLRLWAHQCAAHGAEGIVFFRWRMSPAGQEMFGNGLLDQDSKPRRTYHEVKELGQDFERLAKQLPQYDAPAEVAIVWDFADRIHAQIHDYAMDVPFLPHLATWWTAAHKLGLNCRFVRSTDDLAPYAMVIAPSQYTTSDEIAGNYTSYVDQGGTLVGMLRMGCFDVYGKPSRKTLPGGMTELFGVEVDEYERVMEPNPNRVVFRDEIGPPAECRHWNYVLAASAAEALGTYEQDHYAGAPAVTLNAAGRGRAVYVGTMLDADAASRVVAYLAKLSGLEPRPGGWPDEVEVVRLAGKGGEPIRVLMNHSMSPQTVRLPAPGTDLLTGESAQDVALEPLSARWVAL